MLKEILDQLANHHQAQGGKISELATVGLDINPDIVIPYLNEFESYTSAENVDENKKAALVSQLRLVTEAKIGFMPIVQCRSPLTLSMTDSMTTRIRSNFQFYKSDGNYGQSIIDVLKYVTHIVNQPQDDFSLLSTQITNSIRVALKDSICIEMLRERKENRSNFNYAKGQHKRTAAKNLNSISNFLEKKKWFVNSAIDPTFNDIANATQFLVTRFPLITTIMFQKLEENDIPLLASHQDKIRTHDVAYFDRAIEELVLGRVFKRLFTLEIKNIQNQQNDFSFGTITQHPHLLALLVVAEHTLRQYYRADLHVCYDLADNQNSRENGKHIPNYLSHFDVLLHDVVSSHFQDPEILASTRQEFQKHFNSALIKLHQKAHVPFMKGTSSISVGYPDELCIENAKKTLELNKPEDAPSRTNRLARNIGSKVILGLSRGNTSLNASVNK